MIWDSFQLRWIYVKVPCKKIHIIKCVLIAWFQRHQAVARYPAKLMEESRIKWHCNYLFVLTKDILEVINIYTTTQILQVKSYENPLTDSNYLQIWSQIPGKIVLYWINNENKHQKQWVSYSTWINVFKWILFCGYNYIILYHPLSFWSFKVISSS